jgi:hypothetical protein
MTSATRSRLRRALRPVVRRDADLGQGFEHLRVDGRAGVRAGGARLVAAACGLPEKPFRDHGPAAIGHADEENVAHSGCAIVVN